MLGASGDHLVLSAGDRRVEVGAQIPFQVNYVALVRAMTSPFLAEVLHGETGP